MGIGASSHRTAEERRGEEGREGEGSRRRLTGERASRAEEREEWEPEQGKGEWERRAGLGLDGGVYDRGPLRKEGPQH